MLEKITENNQTNAGICPKSDPTQKWGGISPQETPDPETWRLCGNNGEICTFPFIFNSVTYFEPYQDETGQPYCGTRSDNVYANEYDDVEELHLATPCSGEYSRKCVFELLCTSCTQ